jgi:phenylacetate-CoA ligase
MIHADLDNPEYITWKAFLHQADNWTREQIKEYQLAQVIKMVTLAYYRTNGYLTLYDQARVSPHFIKTLDDLRRFPFTTKEMIHANLDDFSRKLERREYTTTGGSTGEPFGFYRDPVAFAKELASKAHQYARIGWLEGDRQIILRGLQIDNPGHVQFVPEFCELRFSSYHLVPEQMEFYRQAAIEYQPDWLRCYPSAGYLFARWLKENEREFPTLKGVLCASENLYEFQKELMAEVFSGRVFSHYGQWEMVALAGYCEHADTYHVLPQYSYVELIDEDGEPVTKPGKMGEVVGTSFIQRATPFIRYRTGDYAVLAGWKCPQCGRPYQTWERIEGRRQEFIVTGKGRRVSLAAMNFHDDIFDNVTRFQFHQARQGHVEFRFVPTQTCDESVVADMKRRLLVKLGNDVVLEMVPVDHIPLTERGKRLLSISEVARG